MTLHKKILEHKAKAAPINSRSLSIAADGTLKERESLLDKRIVEGYTVMFNGEGNSHRELFIKGSYAKTIRENGPGNGGPFEIKFYAYHNGVPLANLDVLEEREQGVYFRTKPLDEGEEEDRILRKLKSGTLNNYSQEFLPVWEPGKVEYDDKRDLIIFKEVQLFGISVVGKPSDKQTYTIRSVEALEELTDETEDFIKSLPKRFQLEARQIIARHKALVDLEPLKGRAAALQGNEPQEPREAVTVSKISLLNKFNLK